MQVCTEAGNAALSYCTTAGQEKGLKKWHCLKCNRELCKQTRSSLDISSAWLSSVLEEALSRKNNSPDDQSALVLCLAENMN